MSTLKNALKEEQERLLAMLRIYKEEIKALPKGSVQYKSIKGKKYPYLTYRQVDENKKSRIHTVYIKQQDLDHVLKKIEKRKKLMQYIKEAEKDLEIIRKAGINKNHI